MAATFTKTSEAVSIGHPDKIADQLADTLLDYLRTFKEDPQAGIEVACGATQLLVFGEIDAAIVKPNGSRSVAVTNPQLAEKLKELVREKLDELGYSDYQPLILLDLVAQSEEINSAVEASEVHEAGAGDQGIVTGFATAETLSGHALHYILPHALMKGLEEERKSGRMPWLLPDAKAQVTVRYSGDEYGVATPIALDHVLISHCHTDALPFEEVKSKIEARARELLAEELRLNRGYLPYEKLLASLETATFVINPAGPWHFGGPAADSGLTGRKLVVDNYGSAAPIGGGATSGKNLNKVDRSGAYFARLIAKSIVASGLAQKVQVELSFAIGLPKPTSFTINTFGTEVASLETIYAKVHEVFDFSVSAIIARSQAVESFEAVSRHGNYTDPSFPWEQPLVLSPRQL